MTRRYTKEDHEAYSRKVDEQAAKEEEARRPKDSYPAGLRPRKSRNPVGRRSAIGSSLRHRSGRAGLCRILHMNFRECSF